MYMWVSQCSLRGGESQDPDLALVDSKTMHFKLHVVIQSLSHVWLYSPTDCSPPGLSVPGVLQARILEWVSIFFFPHQGSNPRLLHWQADSYYWGTREAFLTLLLNIIWIQRLRCNKVVLPLSVVQLIHSFKLGVCKPWVCFCKWSLVGTDCGSFLYVFLVYLSHCKGRVEW